MIDSRFCVIQQVSLGKQGDYRVVVCQYCGASAAVREDSPEHAVKVAQTFMQHHTHAAARMRQAA